MLIHIFPGSRIYLYFMMIGQIIGGHYEIIKSLGQGGFGKTFLAKDKHLPDQPLRVVKLLHPLSNDPFTLQTAYRLFETEAEAEVLYKLGNHPQIPQLFAHFQENNDFYLVQEYIEGHDLSEEIKPGKILLETDMIEFNGNNSQVAS
ncbi:protein kinase domain-containing protein [Crocosphaera sp. XPORK-15E]|uniref:protein kinase domain-containing protein n=1 Tax=Crocosphaera sp. XPORK-15E TaxID=3110247 RepID=UPI002B1F83B7|nr:protein kinase [Crocosphaera sp. XPORK-15E]MEA5536091.1 protein kinase [Crocosphaera sp. XPORK-15E]